MMDARDVGWSIVEIGIAFPDAILSYRGEEWRVEFEYKASNFIQHKHDVRECDMIICWNDDYPDCPIPVLSLKSSDWKVSIFEKSNTKDVEISYWRSRCEKLEYEVARLNSRIEATIITPQEREELEKSSEETMRRRRRVLEYYAIHGSASYQQVSDDLQIISKASVYNDVKWLERRGYVEVIRGTKFTKVILMKTLDQDE